MPDLNENILNKNIHIMPLVLIIGMSMILTRPMAMLEHSNTHAQYTACVWSNRPAQFGV